MKRKVTVVVVHNLETDELEIMEAIGDRPTLKIIHFVIGLMEVFKLNDFPDAPPDKDREKRNAMLKVGTNNGSTKQGVKKVLS